MSMALPVGLDLDLLRTFVAIAEEKSFTRAADRVGRTQSAVSLQMQRLETVLEQTLLDRGKGGSVELTHQGHYLLGRAREILDLNDDILKSLRAAPVHGTIRLGIAEEVAERYLPRVLEHFSEQAPSVEVQVVSSAACILATQFKAGDHDLVILDRGLEPRQWPATEIWRQPMRWITSDEHGQHMRDPLPLVVSPADCPWRPPWLSECLSRGIATRTVDQAGRKFKIVNSASSTAGQFAAVSAGLAVAASMAVWSLPPGLRAVRDGEGLPSLPDASYLMLKARDPRQPMTDMLAAAISAVFGSVPPSPLKFARF
ncbi:LysR family transcriptional regulator [Aestuariivirga sp.]|uniref:LysR family transcriptional regulator n=1 Tax=Aestuariivirga sp. TaxID=2650926 RepID=UPI003593A1E5